jgi:hypothetical protein
MEIPTTCLFSNNLSETVQPFCWPSTSPSRVPFSLPCSMSCVVSAAPHEFSICKPSEIVLVPKKRVELFYVLLNISPLAHAFPKAFTSSFCLYAAERHLVHGIHAMYMVRTVQPCQQLKVVKSKRRSSGAPHLSVTVHIQSACISCF